MSRISKASLIAAALLVTWASPAVSQVLPDTTATRSLKLQEVGTEPFVRLELPPEATTCSLMIGSPIIGSPDDENVPRHARDFGLMRPTSGCRAHERSAATSTFRMEG